nr:sterol 3-beta-glucosyltransferase ugt80b1 [Quercus suber]
MKRTATGGLGQKPTEPYSYQFDPMTSDSSSSSEDEDAITTKKLATARTDNSNAVDTRIGEENKKHARKGRSYSRFALGNEHMKTKGHISKRDGRLNISINDTSNSGYVAKALGQSLKNHLDIPKHRANRFKKWAGTSEHGEEEGQKKNKKMGTDGADEEGEEMKQAKSIAESLRGQASRPRVNIVIMVIGSRGDIQPFLKVGKILKEYGHRVRIASHPTFREFVEKDVGLEFFSVGGDPSELMAFMVKNPGLVPGLKTIREGEVQRRRTAMSIMFDGFWRACVNTADDEHDKANLRMLEDKQPFVADAIIANPPSMAHVHIAEKLGIPLHMMFTFPYSPTQQFPHPLANIKPGKSNVDANYVNFMSYSIVEMMTWQGLGDIVNRFRERTLALEPVSSLWAPGALYRMHVPYTYLWSPSLVPKPKDWGPEIDIAGFVFLDLASNFKPSKELEDFLNAGEPPIYVGFGSIVVDDPDGFTELIIEATKKAGVRCLLNKGWGGLGRGNNDTPDHIFMLGNTPHDWLFPKVKAVVHHGGAGTTAIGLKCGKPTMIVPFFGDQPFWGAMVAEAKAGAFQCIPYKNLTVERLTEGIKQCLTEEAQTNVQKIADSIDAEGDGAENAVKSFHRSLPLAGKHNMRCAILEDQAAVWQLRNSSVRLSTLAAEILHQKGKLKYSDLKLLRVFEWNDFDGPGEPITGTVGAVGASLYDIGEGVGMVPVRIAEHVRKHEAHQRKRSEIAQRKEERRKAKAGIAKHMENSGVSADEVKAPVNGNGDNRPSAQRGETGTTLGSTVSETPSVPVTRRAFGEVGSGLKRTTEAVITTPNDLHVAIAQGFHNAPRLWGDATVRKPVRITGIKSGFTAARKEFAYGIWDGWTGLVTQPIGDWQDRDSLPSKVGGIGTGLGKGIGGFVLKNVSAVVAPPAYMMKGVVKWAEKKSHGPGAKATIRRSRITQGHRQLVALEAEPADLARIRGQVSDGWHVYEQVWAEAKSRFGHDGGASGGKGTKALAGKYRFAREKHDWAVNGALENASTAQRALTAKQQGQDVKAVFAQRRDEIDEAEQTRAGAMEQAVAHEADPERVLPNGRRIDDEDEDDDDDGGRLHPGADEVRGGSTSESTAVATPDEKETEPGAPLEESKAPASAEPSKPATLGATRPASVSVGA